MAPGRVEVTERDATDVIDRTVRGRIVEIVLVAELGIQQCCASADGRMPAAARRAATKTILFSCLCGRRKNDDTGGSNKGAHKLHWGNLPLDTGSDEPKK